MHIQKKIIDSFPEPKNDYERVNYSIESNRLNRGGNKKALIINAVSMLAIPLFMLLYCFNRLFARKNKQCLGQTLVIESTNRRGAKYSFEGRLPALSDEYGKTLIIETGVFPKLREGLIGWKSVCIFSRFVSYHPFDFFNNLRMLVNLMGYNRLLYLYQPFAIINSRMELNHNSSLITLLCENSGCKFINVMHGEALYNIETAFVRFSEFYIWDNHYIDVFTWSRSPVEQFKVYQPDIYKRCINNNHHPEYYITYIFTGDEEKGLDENAYEVREILLKFMKTGKRCKVRPHPRWSDMQQLSNIFSHTGILVEDPKAVKVIESLSNTEKVVGTFSTVMSEAFYANIDIVIDDISDKDIYDSLYERGYILINKPHELLSQIVPE